MNLIVRIVGASVISLVLFRWYVYAAMNRGISTRYTPTSFSIVRSGRFRLGHRLDEPLHRLVGRHGEPLGLHLAQLGEPLVPQVGVPRVVVAVRAETHLHVEFGDRGDPPAERLEELHLGPLVVADPSGGLDDVERTRQVSTIPGCERGTRASTGLSVGVSVAVSAIPRP